MPRANSQQKPLNWWAQRWIEVCELVDAELEGRFARGRSYARSGHVWRLAVRPGFITAEVAGSSSYFYNTEVAVPVLPDAVWDEAIVQLSREALTVSKLLAGEMPSELEDILLNAGGSLFPEGAWDFASSCTCPDMMDPCKHVAAVCYEFGAKLDQQPNLLLVLRGRSIDELLAGVRALWAGEKSPTEDSTERTSGSLLNPHNFYNTGEPLDAWVPVYTRPAVEGQLLDRVGNPPFVPEGQDLRPMLTAVYSAMTDEAYKLLDRTPERRRLPPRDKRKAPESRALENGSASVDQ